MGFGCVWCWVDGLDLGRRALGLAGWFGGWAWLGLCVCLCVALAGFGFAGVTL